ncbi:MAG: hypothetical protein ACOY93_22940 [Bacillota bacterium]
MAPKYMIENRFSFLAPVLAVRTDYQAETPETAFEREVQSLLAEAGAHLAHEEYRLALDGYRELAALILSTADPKLPAGAGQNPSFRPPRLPELLDPLINAAANILKATPTEESLVPSTLISTNLQLPAQVRAQLQPFAEAGLQTAAFLPEVELLLSKAEEAVQRQDWPAARQHYEAALKAAPAEEKQVQAYLTHDLAVIHEKAGNRPQALRLATKAAQELKAAGAHEGSFRALRTLAGLHARAGETAKAGQALAEAAKLHKEHALNPIRVERPEPSPLPIRRRGPLAIDGVRPLSLRQPFERIPGLRPEPGIPGRRPRPERPGPGTPPPRTNPDVDEAAEEPAVLLAPKLALAGKKGRKLTILGEGGAGVAIPLDQTAPAKLKQFYTQRAKTEDLQLLDGLEKDHATLVAYLPHVYFFTIPMAMGDCYAGLGNFARAEEEYLSCLQYPFINQKVEIVKLWSRLAELYVEWGETLYRRARNNVAGFGPAREMYRRVIREDGTPDAESPLYKDPKFASIRSRVQGYLANATAENPQIVIPVLEARQRLEQIAAGLNFFGFSPTYTPPFSFEYLQNTARYFAQHATRIEQAYIQYKSQAENEEFRQEQMEQQAELARATVELEQRGLAETRAGVDVAEAAVNYAEVQRQNAVKAKNDFAAVRWELAELAEAEAWAQASSVDREDQVKLTWNGHYYSSSKKRRNVVLQELARQRTRISHDLEAKRLQREVDSAAAYKQVAREQLDQARARVRVAEQRVAIARLQQQFAEENRDFLDHREFSARLWYELARVARRLSRRYLDMAIAVASLMEQAYKLETGRPLAVIKFDYSNLRLGNLMGGDMLLADIDSFTLDYITTTRSKKAPIKQTISLADTYPMAFRQLKQTGSCFFETTLAQFDRAYPGAYLAKLVNVEVLFVGITGATGVHGSLRNIGVSAFRTADGTIRQQVYPQDLMPLSQYQQREDALIFRINPNELRLFENNGIATRWQLELPLDANDFDYRQILDIQLVLYYDAFYSATLEQQVRASLPAGGSASRALSLAMFYPDELFYLKNQGSAEIAFDASMFPANQVNLVRSRLVLRCTGDPAAVGGLRLRLFSRELGSEVEIQTAPDGTVDASAAGSPLAPLLGRPLLDEWTIRIKADDNPGVLRDGQLDLTGIGDLLVFVEYSFDYRTSA